MGSFILSMWMANRINDMMIELWNKFHKLMKAGRIQKVLKLCNIRKVNENLDNGIRR